MGSVYYSLHCLFDVITCTVYTVHIGLHARDGLLFDIFQDPDHWHTHLVGETAFSPKRMHGPIQADFTLIFKCFLKPMHAIPINDGHSHKTKSFHNILRRYLYIHILHYTMVISYFAKHAWNSWNMSSNSESLRRGWRSERNKMARVMHACVRTPYALLSTVLKQLMTHKEVMS